jgi:hypothetical protein
VEERAAAAVEEQDEEEDEDQIIPVPGQDLVSVSAGVGTRAHLACTEMSNLRHRSRRPTHLAATEKGTAAVIFIF